MEHADRVRAAADAGHEDVGEFLFARAKLPARFFAEHFLEFAHHQRIGMRPERAAEQVISVARVRDPIAQGFVDRVLERARTVLDHAHFRAEQSHAQDVRLLPAHVFRAHVNDAFQTEQRADSRGRDAVLTRAGLGDDAALAHALGEQALAERVVDLVRAGVEQVFAFQKNARAARVFRQARGEAERRRPTGVIALEFVEPGFETAVAQRGAEFLREFFERRDQCFRDETAAVVAPKALRIGFGCFHKVTGNIFVARTALTKRRTFSSSFTPGAHSTPLQTSTANGRTVRMASRDVLAR